MRKSIIFISILGILFCFGCQKDKILSSKPGEPINKVTNLAYTVSNKTVNITWVLPSTLPADIIKPVSVIIYITIDGINKGTIILDNAPTSYSYTTYNGTSNKYRFTVKVMGKVNTTDVNFSNLRYSLGETVYL